MHAPELAFNDFCCPIFSTLVEHLNPLFCRTRHPDGPELNPVLLQSHGMHHGFEDSGYVSRMNHVPSLVLNGDLWSGLRWRMFTYVLILRYLYPG